MREFANASFLSSKEIRRQFLNFFAEKGHTIVPSSSLIPSNDPTLLFTNAGMVQFKDVFLGREYRSYTRAVSSQRCVRAGGKHNDLERVGYTARHHTFFEMLGNFSFGDYFKREAIHFAWEFLTQKMHLPIEKLWVTVFKDDEEASKIWLEELKIDPKRFSRCDEQDNFWAMGPTGPCGPCTEIFYDHGPHIAGGPPGSPDADGDRYIEIWNLVFMQYDRSPDGSLNKLPKPSVDTGMGLERIAAVLQGVHNNYDTDLFQPLIKKAAQLAKRENLPLSSLSKAKGNKADCADPRSNLEKFSLCVISDHIRSASFLILDGITPSNEGRGYVLRRIIRRALRHGHQIGIALPFFYQVVQPLVDVMGEAYPALIDAQSQIELVIRQEEEQFSATLSQGLAMFEQIRAELKGDIIPGELVFKLYDTYGFPADLTADLAREKGLMIDNEEFEAAMEKQRERSREASQFSADYLAVDHAQPPTIFTGHKNLLAEKTPDHGKILAIYREGRFVNEITAGEKASIVLDQTPFYAESGGQVGDQGILFKDNNNTKDNNTRFTVLDTIKQGHMHLHLGKLEKGKLAIGDEIVSEVDAKRRAATVLNHTATHLLHLVLRRVLGEQAIQKGSLVEPDRLRFDFAYHTPLTGEQIKQIEERVNQEIRANYAGKVEISTPEEAIASGAVALFGEKYGSKVRVVHFGPSVELCGGTHAEYTGDIGFFKITSESGIASGIRRIEAVTGGAVLAYLEKKDKEMQQKLSGSEERIHSLEKETQKLKDKIASLVSESLLKQIKSVGQIKVLAAIIEDADGKLLRNMMDQLKTRLGSGIIILATAKNNKVGLIGGVTADLIDRYNAKEMINMLAQQVGGKGGGRSDLAEAGGNNLAALEKALQSIYTWIQEKAVS